jgi:hypothetical protein
MGEAKRRRDAGDYGRFVNGDAPVVRAMLDKAGEPELSRIDGFKGDLEWLNSYDRLLWSGISQEAVDALNSLLKAGEVHMKPTMPLVYMCDGVMIRLPTVKRAVKYKSPHWLPVVFNPGPPKLPKGRKSSLLDAAGAP